MRQPAILEEKDFDGVVAALVIDNEQDIRTCFVSVEADTVRLKIRVGIGCQVDGPGT